MANVTVTTAANFIPEMWRDAILDYAERKFQLRNQVTDFSSMVSGGGDILNIPKVAEEAAAAKSAGMIPIGILTQYSEDELKAAGSQMVFPTLKEAYEFLIVKPLV